MSHQFPIPDFLGKLSSFQAQVLSEVVGRRDVIASSCAEPALLKAGAISMLCHLKAVGGDGLILTPTPEGSVAAAESMKEVGAFFPGVRIRPLVGDEYPMSAYHHSEGSARILLGGIEKMLDCFRRGYLLPEQIKVLSLHGAHILHQRIQAAQWRELFKFLPRNRQILMFTEDISVDLEDFADSYMRRPARIEDDSSDADFGADVSPVLIRGSLEEKKHLLIEDLLNRNGSMLVFVRNKTRSERVAGFLGDSRKLVGRLHGGRTHKQCMKDIERLLNGEIRILVCTDQSVREHDVPRVRHVISYDLPELSSDFSDRLRFVYDDGSGDRGEVVHFITPDEEDLWSSLSAK